MLREVPTPQSSGDGNVIATDVQGGIDSYSTVVDFFDPFTNFLSHTGLPQYLDALPPVSGMKVEPRGEPCLRAGDREHTYQGRSFSRKRRGHL